LIIERGANSCGHVLFHAVQFHGGHELAIGKLGKIFDGAADASESLNVIIPRRDILIADRPVDGDAFLRVGFEIEIAEAIALTPPHQRAAADVITAEPIEGFLLDVRALGFVDPKVVVGLIEDIIATLNGVRFLCGDGVAAAVGDFPRSFERVNVVFDVLDVAASLQEQNLEAFFG
jgi:hypothetical protein